VKGRAEDKVGRIGNLRKKARKAGPWEGGGPTWFMGGGMRTTAHPCSGQVFPPHPSLAFYYRFLPSHFPLAC